MRKVFFTKSNYVSSVLTDGRRTELRQLCARSKRTTFHELTDQEVSDLNELSKEELELGVAEFTCQEAIDHIGLTLVEPIIEYYTDDNGNYVLNDEGEKEKKSTSYPEYRLQYTVKVGGFVDANGKEIAAKVSHRFDSFRQSMNRPTNEGNWKALAKRMPRWCLNGEVIIRDSEGRSQSEQHRMFAFIYAVLTGILPPDAVFTTAYSYGAPSPLCLTIDTGKANTGKDVFGSDPEICPEGCLRTIEGFLHNTDDYEADRMGAKKTICGETESAAKKLLLRGAGKNVNSSIPSIDEPTKLAHSFVIFTCPQLDDLVARCVAFTKGMAKRRPTSASDIATAICLYQWRNEDRLATLPKVDGLPPDSVELSIDIEEAMLLLEEFNKATGEAVETPIAKWITEFIKQKKQGRTKQTQFAALCRLVAAFYGDEEVTPELNNVSQFGGREQSASKGFYHFGGFDRGPAPKKAKKEKTED